MSEPDLAKGEAVRNAYKEAVKMKSEGVPADIIRDVLQKKLREKGITPAAAVMICDNLPGIKPELEKSPQTGKKNMFLGAALFIFSVLVTWVSELVTLKKSGVYYVIAIGLMFTGLGFLIKGVFDYKSQC